MNNRAVYLDPEKQYKLEEAIRQGFIRKSFDKDGVVKYSLTPLGQHRWFWERANGLG